MVIEVAGLTKAYGSHVAVRGVDLCVEQGTVFAILGPNGAGKTSIVEILEGYRRRSAGEVRVLGIDPERGTRSWRARLGVVPQSTRLEPELRVSELVAFYAGLYPDPMPAGELIDLVGMADRSSVRCGRLSGGETRRLDVALALVGQPELVFLDEPTTGFDPEARRAMWEVLRRLRSTGTTVLLTTHYLDEAEYLADRIAVVVDGEVVASGPPRTLGGRDRAPTEVSCDLHPLLRGNLPRLAGELERLVDGERLTLKVVEPLPLLAELAGWSEQQGVSLRGLEVRRPSLERIYLRLVSAGSTRKQGALR